MDNQKNERINKLLIDILPEIQCRIDSMERIEYSDAAKDELKKLRTIKDKIERELS